MIKSKKQMLVIIGVFTLILTLATVSYAFFNYTRTGGANVIRTGNIYFNATEGTALNVTNSFPMTSTEAANANLDSVTLGIVGNTTYNDGEEYQITLVDVNNTINGKEIPINFIATYTATSGGTVGTSSDTYWTARNSKDATIYTLKSTSEVSEGKQVLVGYIDNESTGISGTLTIKAYIDADRIAITDTYNGPSSTPNDNNGTTNEWVNGRIVFTTDEWNSLTSNPISFKIKVESNEGIWVEEQLSRNDMKQFDYLFTDYGEETPVFEGRKSSITEINFVRMSEDDINAHNDAIDITRDNGKGMVKIWIDGTKLYIASPGKTYLPSISSGLLMNFTNVTSVTFNNVDTSEVTIMPGFFQNDSSLTSVDLHGFDTSNVTNMSAMFMDCSSLTDVDLSYLDTSSIEHMSGMFTGCTSLQTANISNLGSDHLVSSYMFYGVGSTTLRRVNMSNFNFGVQTGLSGMFNSSDFVNTEEIILRNANTSNITSMSAAFGNLRSLKTVDLRGIDTSNVTNMSAMFESCFDLENILGIENINTSSVTNMQAMFSHSSSLTSLNLSNFDTSHVTSMAAMFANCTGLTSVNLSSFNTTSLTNMAGMFFGDVSLTSIDLSSFNTSNVTEMNLMFAMAEMDNNDNLIPANNVLTTIKVGNNWNTNNVTSDTNMFYNCTHLVGGQGTTYNSSIIDKTYARIDGGSLNPGYFTLAN